MQPEEYKGTEWTTLLRELTPRQLRNTIKGGYRRTAKKVAAVARQQLKSSGLHVEGDSSDWERGIRTYIYSKGGGFLITVRPRKGKKELGYHAGRRYGKTITRGARKGSTEKRKLPVLMFAEDGTRQRNTGSRIGGSSFFSRSRYTGREIRNYKRGGHSTGSMPAYHFLRDSEEPGLRIVENDLGKDLEVAVTKAAKKAGFI